MPLPQHLPLQPGNWNPLNDFLGVGHNSDGTTDADAATVNAPTVDDLLASTYYVQSLAVAGEQLVFVAPCDCQLVGASLVCQGGAVAASDTNFWTVTVKRFRGIESYYNQVLSGTPVVYWPLDDSTGTTATGVNAINSATMNVGDTTVFPAAGAFVMGGVSTAYTAKTGTTFTGCGNHAATTGGEAIYLPANDVVAGLSALPNAGVTVSQAGLTGYRASYLFNGSTGFLSVPNNTALDLGDGPFSIEAWFSRAVQGAAHTILHRGTNAYSFSVDAGNVLKFSKAGVVDMATAGPTVLAGTHHVVATRAGNGDISLYLDGADVTTRSGGAYNPATVLTDNASVLNIGRTTGAVNFFNGNIDNTALYKRVLTAAEVAQHYASGQNPGTIATKTTKVTNGEAIAQRADWNFETVQFDASLRVLQRGDVVYFGLAPTLSPANLVNTLCEARYRPL